MKKRWLKKILAGHEDWEIRGSRTTSRGWIHLAESGAGGKLVGRVEVVDRIPVDRSSFLTHVRHHHVEKLSDAPHKIIYAWVLRNAAQYKKAFECQHAAGAIAWVRV